MAEGQLINGDPNGFVRVIDGFNDVNFVGYMEHWQIMQGNGLFFQNSKLIYSGIYDVDRDDYYIYSKGPKYEKDFKLFTHYIPDVESIHA